jgi:hypothetical protein
MRDLLKYLSMAVIMIVLMACNNDTPNTNSPSPKPEPEPEPGIEEINSYTIMIYGCGGKELDEYIEATIRNVTLLDDIPSHINIVGQIKWSNDYTSEWSSGDGGVTRLKYNHATKIYDNEPFDSNDFKIDDPSNLAEFIEWARHEAPADEYTILFAGHGNAYHPSLDGNVTRAILRDDEDPVYLGLSGIIEAFETTEIHFNLIHMLCCLMNSIEYATELEPYTNYYLASNHVTSISNGEIYLLVEGLIAMDKYDETSIATAAAYAIDQDYDMWWSQNILAIDHTLTKCSEIAELNNAIREFTDVVVALYAKQREIGSDAMMSNYGFTTATIDTALSKAYYPVNATFSESYIKDVEWYRMDYAFDIVDIAAKVAEATKHGDIVRAAENIEIAAAEAITHQRSVNLVAVDRVYYTITLINNSQWSSLDLEGAGYERTAFDKATGWSRLLKVNNATFMHCR